MTQRVKEFVTKPNGVSSIPSTHTVLERELTLQATYTPMHMYTRVHTHIHTK